VSITSEATPVTRHDTGPVNGTATTADPSTDLLAGLRNGAWLDGQVFPPLRYAVPGLIPEGSVLLCGAPKIGKSWFVLGCCLAVAAGGTALAAIATGEPQPVLYLALEDGDRRMQDRCRKLLSGAPIPARFDYMTRITPGQLLPTITAWLDRHPDGHPLVVIDTLGKVMPAALIGESAYQRDYRTGSALKRLCDTRPGLTLLVNHHERKAASDDFVDSVSGTHGLAGAADTIIVLDRDRGKSEGRLKVTGRDVSEGEYALTIADGCQWTLDGDLDQAASQAAQMRAVAGLGDRSAEVTALVSRNSDGTRAADVARALGTGEATARTYLARLHESGRIARPARGLYTPLPTTPVASVTSVASDGTGGVQRNTYNTRNTPTGECSACGEPMIIIEPGQSVHPTCEQP
jgi:AAA domain